MLDHAALMELISATCAGLAAPPLPVIAMRGRPAGQGGGDVPAPVSSHDIIAANILAVAGGTDPVMHARRRAKQDAATSRLCTALTATRPGAATYLLFQTFTADYISAYEDRSVPLAFAPPDAVPSGSSVHAAAAGWSAGQDILKLPAPLQRTSAQYGQQPYPALIVQAHARFLQFIDAQSQIEDVQG